jgi:MSHA biogenesis protein MshN
MSVINQMLKDLEQRTPAQEPIALPVANSHKPSTIKIALISLVVLVSLNALGLYIWDLQKQVTSSELKVKEQMQGPIVNVSQDSPRQSIETFMPDRETLDRQASTQKNIPISETKADLAIALPQQSMMKEKANLPESPLAKVAESRSPVQPESAKVERDNSKFVNTALVNAIPANTSIESQMSVSRRQLSSKEVVEQKLVRAEKAIKTNNIIKAEQLFEEVLIIAPNHKQTRKNLAALWFGRKSYQQATNLLSQGISLDRSDAALRLLKARIHLQQGQNKSAYDTLKPLSLLKQQEYQVMLANVSQQIEQYKSAIQAYKILIDMQAYSGRWHLGLAIVYDKNSQFSLAVTEYALALTKSDLSVASAEFAQQRMQALGE